MYCKSKEYDGLREYSDTTCRIFKASGIISFDNGFVELAYKELARLIFDEEIIKNNIFGASNINFYNSYENEEDCLFYRDLSLIEILSYSDEKVKEIKSQIQKEFGGKSLESIPAILSAKRSQEFNQFILENYPVEKVNWKEKGLVKASMQGCAGTPCTKDEYDAFLKMLEAKGFDTSHLPQIAYTGLPNDVGLNVERDVEEKLLEPLLKKLGYTEKNWVRQLPVRMGRGERNYPDYALFPKGTKSEETAQFLWEAKFTISSRRQLQDAFLQAKSYAMRLQSKGFGLVAKEGIWISVEKDSFLFEKIKSYSWADLENPDVFSKVNLSLK